MTHFSFLYQSNIIRVFPLRAGVIGRERQVPRQQLRVSPACGGYRWTPESPRNLTECFPCVGVIGEQRTENNA